MISANYSHDDLIQIRSFCRISPESWLILRCRHRRYSSSAGSSPAIHFI
jgi:hypothetical protein